MDDFELLTIHGYEDYFREKNLRSYDVFQMNIELSYRLVVNQTRYPSRTQKEMDEISIQTGRPEFINSEIKDQYVEWMMLAGFEELFKWIKDVLIDFLFLHSKMGEEIPSSADEFYQERASLMRLSIPGLINRCKAITGELDEYVQFDSFNKLRNCLHHRGKIVTSNFTNDAGKLVIKGKRFSVFSENEHEKRELLGGLPGLVNGTIKLGLEDYEIEFQDHDIIQLSLQEFSYIKDLGLLLYVKLSTSLFGEDDKPLLKLNIAYQVKKA